MMRWLKDNLSTDICNKHIQTCHQQPPNERYQPRALASENLGGGGGRAVAHHKSRCNKW